jgi:hypothetical protein
MAIIIQVEGGVVQAVFSESDINMPEVIVMDYDEQSEDNPIIGIQVVDVLDPDCDVAKDLAKWRN